MENKKTIYKVLDRETWIAAETLGEFKGAAIDLTDGFIHLSSAEQVVRTVELHFAGKVDLVLIGVDPDRVTDLRWEPSRDGELFPHLYDTLKMNAVVSVDELPIGKDGNHIFPTVFD